ncbi:MAG: DUF4188 domain-containing protein [Anaerolineae bacterium]|nr:DUF4188 domain-containing protein [Anaerolineae bacterium]
MHSPVNRNTADLTDYPDLVVIYFGLEVQSLQGMMTTLRLGRAIDAALRQRPDGLLRHELMLFGLFPFQIGMRQYWRNFEAMEAWSRILPHREWWESFLHQPRGIGLWHEIYTQQHGIEGIYDNMSRKKGLSRFAPLHPARGRWSSARGRLGKLNHKDGDMNEPVNNP